MEFVLNAVNVEYADWTIYEPYTSRDRMLPRVRFRFHTEHFVPMGIIAQLKKRPEFIAFLKQEIMNIMQNLNDDDFDRIRNGINQCNSVQHAGRYSSSRKNSVMKLGYNNGTTREEGQHYIEFYDNLEGWVTPVESRIDLVRAVSRITQLSIKR